jgi:PAS domain-containing protein
MKHRRLSEALWECEQRFRAAFDASAAGTALIAPDGSVLQINQEYCDILGYSSRELIERGLHDITHPDDWGVELEYMRRALAGGGAHDFNNVLMVIIGYCGLILQPLPDQDPIRHDIGNIKMAGERAAALTAKLLLALGCSLVQSSRKR